MTFAKKLTLSLLFIGYCCAMWRSATVLRNTEAVVTFLTKLPTLDIICYSYAVFPVTYTPLLVPGDPKKCLRPGSQISFLQEGTESCDRVVSCPLYSDVPEFKSRASGQLLCRKSSLVFSKFPSQIPDDTLNYTMRAFFHILSNLSFTKTLSLDSV